MAVPSLLVADAIRLFLDHRRRKRRAPATLELYAHQLGAWVCWRQDRGYGERLADVTLDELRAFFAYLADELVADRGLRRGTPGLSPRTIHGYHRTLRVFWRWLEYEEDAAGAPLLRAPQLRLFRNDRIPLPAIDRREGPAIAAAQYEQLLAAAQLSEEAEERARDELILRLLWETGLRVHELAGLADDALDLRRRVATLIGKGRKEGVVFWGPATAAALRAYLRQRRGRLGGPLLRGVSSRNNGEATTPNLIRCLVKRLASRAGVRLPPGSPCHAFRRAFARRARAGGATEEEVGQLLRDDSLLVVRGYLGRDMEPRQRIYDRVFGTPPQGGVPGQTLNR